MAESSTITRETYDLGHRNLALDAAVRRLNERIRKDRRGNCDPEYDLIVGPGMSEEICAVLAALATGGARE